MKIAIKMENKNESKWIAKRGDEIVRVFEDRKKTVKWLKDCFKQMLSDFKTQDKTDEYDYSIHIKELLIFPIKQRESYLGL